jgi:hypothetical protein
MTMTRRRTYGMAMAAAAGAVLVATPSSAVTTGQVPTAENAEYDVQNYELGFAYNRAAGAIDATTTMTMTTESAVRSLTIDFARTPTAVTANGEPATVTEEGDKTVITLSRTLPAGETLTLVVTYAVTPSASDNGAEFPRLVVPDGEVEPAEAGLPAWLYPHSPRPDAATFDISSTLPALLAARTDDGMRYLDAAQIRQLREAAAVRAEALAARVAAARAEALAARAAAQNAAADGAAQLAAARADAYAARRAAARDAARDAAADRAERRARWQARWEADRDRDRSGWNRSRGDRDDRGDRNRGGGEGRGHGHGRG